MGEPGTARSERRARIAIVDDDGRYLRGLGRVLARQAPIDIALLTDRDVAHDGWCDDDFDLIVLDAYMPSTSGIDACRALRASGNATPVVVASSHMTRELQGAALSAGANYTLSKPIDPAALFELLERATRSANDAETTERKALVSQHLELARNIARRLGRRYGALLGPEDIEGLAMLGLCEAASRYDAARAEPFVAFAARRVRGAVIDQLRRMGSLSRELHRRSRRISTVRRLITNTGDEATDVRVAQALGIPEQAVRAADESQPVVRVDACDVESLPSDTETPEAHVEHRDSILQLVRARQALSTLETTVIAMRYDEGLPFAEIARRLDLAPARVAQIHQRSLARLRIAFDEG